MKTQNLTPNQMLQAYLMASYAYYIRYTSVMPDEEYDMLAKSLKKHWDSVEHQHKYLVTPEDLAAGTLYSLKAEDYPMIVRQAAEMWIEKSQENKMAGE